MNLLDVVLLLVLLGYAVSGLRHGLVVSAASLGGFVLGAAVGMQLLPDLVAGWPPGWRRTAVLLGGVLVLGWLGQALGSLLGRRLRAVVSWQPARALDSALGAVATLVVVALVVWFVAGAVRGGPLPSLSRAVATSKVVQVIDEVVPPRASGLFSSFRSVVEAQDFPRVFTGTAPEPIASVPPPDPAVAEPAAAAAAGGIVKVTGDAPACGRGREGTGFVVAPGRVVTNAHVVAAVESPSVQVGGTGDRLPARVVLFDPARDLAVLAVAGLGAAPLPLGEQLGDGADAVVAGFPLDGPYRAVPARVREVVRAQGRDIYSADVVVRQVYSLAATVEPGNSGGPLLDAAGEVVGVVFARSLDDAGTGYAMTLAEVSPVLAAASQVRDPVSTGGCTTG